MFNPPMAMGGGGGGWMPLPLAQQVFQFFLGMERAFFQTKLLAVGSSLGHLSMKFFLDRTYRLGHKIRQRESAGGSGNHSH